jgi:hypothetical protein
MTNVYKNLNSIADSILVLSNTQSLLIDAVNSISKTNNIINDDELDLSLSVDDVSKKVDILTQFVEDREDTHNELSDDVSLLKSSLSLIDVKLNTLLKSTEYLLDIKG